MLPTEPILTIGNYILRKRLGAGYFASVYHSTHKYLGTEHAIKIMHAEHLRSIDT